MGAAYFIAGRLAGVESTLHEGYWQELSPMLATLFFDQQVDEDRRGLRVVTLGYTPWVGQMASDGRQTVYASVFRNVAAEATPVAGSQLDGSCGAASLWGYTPRKNDPRWNCSLPSCTPGASLKT